MASPIVYADFDDNLTYDDGGAGGSAVGFGALRYRPGHTGSVSAALVERVGSNVWPRPYFHPSQSHNMLGGSSTSIAFDATTVPPITGATGALKLTSTSTNGFFYTSAMAPITPLASAFGSAWVKSGGASEISAASPVRFVFYDIDVQGTNTTAVMAPMPTVGNEGFAETALKELTNPLIDGASLRMNFEANGAGSAWVAGVQLEQGVAGLSTLIPEYDATPTILPGYSWTSTAHASQSVRAASRIEVPCATAPASIAVRYSEDGTTWLFGYVESLTGNNLGEFGKISYDGTSLVIESDNSLHVGPLFAFSDTLTLGQQATLDQTETWTFGMSIPEWDGPIALAQLDEDLTYETSLGIDTATGIGAIRYLDGHTSGVQAAYLEEPTTNLFTKALAGIDSSGFTITSSLGRTVTRVTNAPPNPELGSTTTAYRFDIGTTTLTAISDAGKSVDVTWAGATPHVVSVWAYIPSSWTGGNLNMTRQNLTSPSGNSTTNFDMSKRDQWQRVVLTNVIPNAADLVGGLGFGIAAPGWNAGEYFLVSGVQIENLGYVTSAAPVYTGGSLNPGYVYSGAAHASTVTRQAGQIQIPCTLPGSVALRFKDTTTGTMVFYYLETFTGNNLGANGRVFHNGTHLVIETDKILVVGPVFAFSHTLTAGQQATLSQTALWSFDMDIPEWEGPLALAQLNGSLLYEDTLGIKSAMGVGALRWAAGHTGGVQAAFVEESTTNYVINPIPSAAWTRSGGGSTYTSAFGHDYGRSTISTDDAIGNVPAMIFSFNSVTFAPSVVLSVSVWVYPSVEDTVANNRIIYSRTGGLGATASVVNGEQTLFPANTWTRLTSIHNMPSTIDQATGVWTEGLTEQTQVNYTEAQMEEKDHITSFCPEMTTYPTLKPGYTWAGTAHASRSIRATTRVEIPCPLPDSVAIRYSEDGSTWNFAYLTTYTGNNLGTYGKMSHNGNSLVIESDRVLYVGPTFVFSTPLTTEEQTFLQSEPVWTFNMLTEPPPTGGAGPQVKLGGSIGEAIGYKVKVGGTILDVVGYKKKIGGIITDV